MCLRKYYGDAELHLHLVLQYPSDPRLYDVRKLEWCQFTETAEAAPLLLYCPI